jgi:gliding motility-associated-like protein
LSIDVFIYRFLSIVIVVFILKTDLYATHNRAGEITFAQKGPLTIEATITLYTKTSSVAADRDSVEIFWGDGTSQFLVRANGWGFPQPNDIKISYYVGTHTYPSRGTYTLSMFDPNRIAGIRNINFPDSESVPFYLETTFTLLNPQFQGDNNSAILLQPPIDVGCVGQIFRHNPNVYDPDGDSIAYELIIPLQSKNTFVPAYRTLESIAPGPNNVFTFDEKTGDIVWNSPQLPGDYNIAFKVKEYRNGQLITSIIRDMQIMIAANCKSVPPQLTLDESRCIIAGDTLVLDITATDTDPGQKVLITASGQPLNSQYGYAYLTNDQEFRFPPVQSNFVWETTCEHIALPYYQILFKAMDNSFSDTSGLTDLKMFRVRVSGPPPLNLKSRVAGMDIILEWDYPYVCANADKNYFRGFSVWRSESTNNFPLDICKPGLAGRGYEIIEYLMKEDDAIYYIYTDQTAEAGKIYCYRVLPEFARLTQDGFPYNPVPGLPSDESCILIPGKSPLITRISVSETGISGGIIEINWIKPDPAVFDTIKYPGPYSSRVLRSKDSADGPYIEVAGSSLSFTNFNALDTFKHFDSGINTISERYFYKIEFLSQQTDRFDSRPASSVFLQTTSRNNRIILEAEYNVPWLNIEYDFSRLNATTNEFELIASNNSPRHTDNDVINGKEYCYLVRTRGFYSGQEHPITNYSQIVCTIPEDTQAPCPPILSVRNECDEDFAFLPDNDLLNYLSWIHPATLCDSADDVSSYNIYFSDIPDSDFQLLFSINDPDKLDTVHLSIDFAGCYFITAIDSSGNESDPSDIICAEVCPSYILPNTFTPNDDGQNDIFKPIYKRHIEKINLVVYNQWGVMVFQTDDPEINWDGTNKNGRKLNAGTYFYVCQPFSRGAPLEVMSGFIELLY